MLRMTSLGASGTSLLAPAARAATTIPYGSRRPLPARHGPRIDLDAEDAEFRHQVLLRIGQRRHRVELARLLDGVTLNVCSVVPRSTTTCTFSVESRSRKL